MIQKLGKHTGSRIVSTGMEVGEWGDEKVGGRIIKDVDESPTETNFVNIFKIQF